MTTRRHHTPDERRRHRAGTVRKPAASTTWMLRSGDDTLASPALSRFVGREAEVAEAQALVTSHRLVTLTGPPGVGKTRLARQLLAHLSEPGNGYVADLEETDDPAAVAATVAGQLRVGVDDGRDPVDALGSCSAPIRIWS